MRSLLLIAPLLLGAAQSTGKVSPTSDVSSSRVTSTGSTTGRALRDHLATLPDARITATGSVVARSLADVSADVTDGPLLIHARFDTPGATASPISALRGMVRVLRASTATFLVNGAEVTAQANEARIDEQGLIIEPATTNVLTNSADFAHADWVKTNAAAVLGATAPDGTATAYTLTDDATNGGHQVYHSYTPGAATYAFSVYAKAGTGSWIRLADNAAAHKASFNLATGRVGTVTGTGSKGEIEPVGNGWYRCTLIAPYAAAGNLLAVAMSTDGTAVSYVGTGSTVFLWRGMFEANPFATTWTATTRAAETVLVTPAVLGSDWCIEATVTPMGAQRWDRGAHHPVFAIGEWQAPNSVEGYVNGGVWTASIYDGDVAEKAVATSALAAGNNYLGERRLAMCSRGFGRPAAYRDGRETTEAVTGTGTGVFVGTGSGQTVLRLGSTLIGSATAAVGGFRIREVKVVSALRPPTRPMGAYHYAWGFFRGYTPAANQIAALGDSITAGIYDTTLTPYPETLAGLEGPTVMAHNFGIGANGTEQVLMRWRADVRGRGFPKMVLLAGINDVNVDMPSAFTIANLETIIDEARADGMTVVVMTLLPGGKPGGDPKRVELDAVNAWLRTNVPLKGAILVDAYAALDDGTGAMAAAYDIDGGSLHPSQAGLDLIAALVSAALP
jgi:lysophospholipase L1-like esterase